MDNEYKVLKAALETLERLQAQKAQISAALDAKRDEMVVVNQQIDEAKIQVQAAKAALKALL